MNQLIQKLNLVDLYLKVAKMYLYLMKMAGKIINTYKMTLYHSIKQINVRIKEKRLPIILLQKLTLVFTTQMILRLSMTLKESNILRTKNL